MRGVALLELHSVAYWDGYFATVVFDGGESGFLNCVSNMPAAVDEDGSDIVDLEVFIEKSYSRIRTLTVEFPLARKAERSWGKPN